MVQTIRPGGRAAYPSGGDDLYRLDLFAVFRKPSSLMVKNTRLTPGLHAATRLAPACRA